VFGKGNSCTPNNHHPNIHQADEDCCLTRSTICGTAATSCSRVHRSSKAQAFANESILFLFNELPHLVKKSPNEVN
jgi:hypothetical protein